MIFLEMYLGEELVDTVALGDTALRPGCYTQAHKLKEALLKKHQSRLLKAETEPCFILSGVQSCINDFVPLGYSRSQSNSWK